VIRRVAPSWSVIVYLVPIFAIALSVSFWILSAVVCSILVSPCTTIHHSGARDDQAVCSERRRTAQEAAILKIFSRRRAHTSRVDFV
jgi:hypothetical protein